MSDLLWGLGLLFDGFLLGWLLALLQEHWYIKMKANPKYRTAMCVDGQFLYVVPEKEYVELSSRRFKSKDSR
jgi:hypothetical protein